MHSIVYSGNGHFLRTVKPLFAILIAPREPLTNIKSISSLRKKNRRDWPDISKNGCYFNEIRSRYLTYSPAPSNPGPLFFSMCARSSRVRSQSSLRTHGTSRYLLFSARARRRPPNVKAFQPAPANSAILELGTSEALLQKYSRREFPIKQQLLFPSCLDPSTSKYRPSPLSSPRLLPFVFALPLLSPPPLLPSVLARPK